MHAAVERGLTWLAAHQAEDGSFGGLSHYGPHVGITGLAGLALMADGNTPGRGRYAVNVERALDFTLSQGSESGLLAAATSHGPMYGHGFATLFLAEIYGMTPRPEVRESVRRAVRLIGGTQNEEVGHQPVRADADISVRARSWHFAARYRGLRRQEIIDAAIKYVKTARPDGGFRYMLIPGVGLARSAGVAALQYTGLYSDEINREPSTSCGSSAPGADRRTLFLRTLLRGQAMFSPATPTGNAGGRQSDRTATQEAELLAGGGR